MNNAEIPTQPQAPKSVEEQANYEGNETLLLFERLTDPVIFNQILDLLYKAEQAGPRRRAIVHEVDDQGNLKFYEDGKPVTFEGEVVPRKREEVEDELKARIEKVKKDTPITFDPEIMSRVEGERECISLNYLFPIPPYSKFTLKQQAIVEAHEKDHAIRRYYGKFFDNLFSGAVNADCFIENTVTPERYEEIKNLLPKNQKGEIPTFEEAKKDALTYNTSAVEISARMAQLKNYFGMRGHEEFTKAHLDYAREHYVEDTGMNNNMAEFFHIIHPETEAKFLELINTTGI
jgi:hypothetical protein